MVLPLEGKGSVLILGGGVGGLFETSKLWVGKSVPWGVFLGCKGCGVFP